MPKHPRKKIPPSQRWDPPPELIPLFLESIPRDISHAIWEQFFRATRDMVAQHTPHLLHLWDFNAREFRWGLAALDLFEQHKKSGAPLPGRALGQIRSAYEWALAGYGFPMLLRILKTPKSVEAAARALEADQLPIVGSHDLAMADQLKESVRICRKFYLRYGSEVTLEQLNELEIAIKRKSAQRGWLVYGPEYYDDDGNTKDDQKHDSTYFEQIATRRVFPALLKLTTSAGTSHPHAHVRIGGGRRHPRESPEFHQALLKLVGFPVPVPTTVLEECLPNWENAAEHAARLLAFYFKKEPSTVAKSLSRVRTALRRSAVQTADIRTFDPRTIDLRPLILG